MIGVFKIFLFTCLVGVPFASSKKIVCQREPEDQLLSSQPLIQVSIFDKPRIHKSFEGYRITCVEANLPLGLSSILSLSILEGGIGCDFVGLQISLGKLITVGIGLKIYGVKANLNELDNLNCRSSDEDNLHGLLGIL